MSRQFLNVLYHKRSAQIDIESMKTFTQVQEKIKDLYGLTAAPAYIELWDATLVDTLDKIKALDKKYFDEPKNDGEWESLTVQAGRQVPLWRATGTITGAREVACRRGLYRHAQNFLGFYEKKAGSRQGAFFYVGETLVINVLFENKGEALHFRSSVIEAVSLVDPNQGLKIDLEVECEIGSELDETILVGHYVPDEDFDPDTTRSVSYATQVMDTSDLFRFQRLEHERFFGRYLKAERAHLIRKVECDKVPSFSKYNENENNFLALSNMLHNCLVGNPIVTIGIPYFNLSIKKIAEQADVNADNRFRVDLVVEAYNNETAALLFGTLKDGSTFIDRTHAETFVYVKDPEVFKVCLAWKSGEIAKAWDQFSAPAVN